MAEYIERKKAIKSLTGWETDPTDEEIEFTIKHIPAADVVEVVRCGECERRDKGFVSENDTICCPYMEAFMRKDDFCSYGERKGGDDE